MLRRHTIVWTGSIDGIPEVSMFEDEGRNIDFGYINGKTD